MKIKMLCLLPLVSGALCLSAFPAAANGTQTALTPAAEETVPGTFAPDSGTPVSDRISDGTTAAMPASDSDAPAANLDSDAPASALPVVGWYQQDGLWRYRDDQGADVIDQWVLDQNSYYYLDGHGYMLTGWLKQGDAWYYMDESGRMATGNVTINGVGYQFQSNGRLSSGGPGSFAEAPATDAAPFVTGEMCTADYWTSRYSASRQLLMDSSAITALNRRILETPEAQMFDLSALPEVFDGQAMAQSLASFASPTGLYLRGQPVPESYYEAIRTNIRGAAVSAQMPLRYGFAINHTLMKAYPYGDFLSDSPQDTEWDQLASSSVYVNEPLAIYFFTADGAFAYVKSVICNGWVPAEDIAVCRDKAQWQDAQNMTQFLMVTGNRVYLEPSADYPESSQKMLTMGTVLELVNSGGSAVTNRLSWNNYTVKLPYRNPDGSFSQRLALIPANRDVSVGCLDLTSEAILTQAFKSLGDRYGWGGMLDSQDCSGYVRDVYRCFGLELPRNTTRQAVMPVRITNISSYQLPEKEALLRSLTPGTILQFPGHELIYLGESGGHFYSINDISSLINPLSSDETPTPSRVRSVIVNDLSTKRPNGHTWLQEITNVIEVWK